MENMSYRGLRAITKKIWLPGARLLVSFAGDSGAEETSVVYCNAWELGSLRWVLHFRRRFTSICLSQATANRLEGCENVQVFSGVAPPARLGRMGAASERRGAGTGVREKGWHYLNPSALWALAVGNTEGARRDLSWRA